MPNDCPVRLRPILADWYIKDGRVATAHDHIVPAGARQQMSSVDQALFEKILTEIDQAAFQPPALAELTCRMPQNEKRIRQLIDLAVAQQKLVRITSGMWLHERRWKELTERVVAAIHERGALSISDIRTILNSSRKYVVPIIEQLDASGITRRIGDTRQLGPRA